MVGSRGGIARLPFRRPSNEDVGVSEPGTEPADPLPKHTTPTWEVELLISGVAVFAMLQLPGWLNDRLMFLLPRFEDGWRASLITVFSYAMGAAVILAATFALHLLLRAYWIALVGMHSVYPDGIRWERLRMGPIEREVMQGRDGDFAAIVERADNRASIVFATGVALAAILLVLIVLVVGLFAAGMAIVTALRWQIRAERLLLIGIAIVLGPSLLISLLDRRWGARLRKDNPLRRVIAAGYNLYARFGFANKGGVLGVLSSHHGRWQVQVIAMVAIVACLFGAMFGQLALRLPERFGSYGGFPHFDKGAADVVDVAYYDDQRDPLRRQTGAIHPERRDRRPLHPVDGALPARSRFSSHAANMSCQRENRRSRCACGRDAALPRGAARGDTGRQIPGRSSLRRRQRSAQRAPGAGGHDRRACAGAGAARACDRGFAAFLGSRQIRTARSMDHPVLALSVFA